MKGIYQLLPSLPKHSFTWDVSVSLGKYRELPPNGQLNLKALTLKTTTLLTLILCQRAQTIFTLDLRYIKKDTDKNTHCLSIFVKTQKTRQKLKASDFETLSSRHKNMPSKSIRHVFTSPTSYRRLIDVETTSCLLGKSYKGDQKK